MVEVVVVVVVVIVKVVVVAEIVVELVIMVVMVAGANLSNLLRSYNSSVLFIFTYISNITWRTKSIVRL